jgi:hypothetical protein
MRRTVLQEDSVCSHFKTGYGALRLEVLGWEAGISMPPFCGMRGAHTIARLCHESRREKRVVNTLNRCRPSNTRARREPAVVYSTCAAASRAAQSKLLPSRSRVSLMNHTRTRKFHQCTEVRARNDARYVRNILDMRKPGNASRTSTRAPAEQGNGLGGSAVQHWKTALEARQPLSTRACAKAAW